MGAEAPAGNTASHRQHGEQNMARVEFTASPAATGAVASGVLSSLSLVPVDAVGRAAWSIDEEEAMGDTWHDSSWMLHKGLDVIEGVQPEAVPAEWQWKWWRAEACDADFPALRLVDLG
jgi:hypothetical protein